MADDASQALGLRTSSVISLDIDAAPGAPILAILPVQDTPFVLDLHPYSVRAENYRVFAQLADGSLAPVEPGPVRTLRGTLLGAPESTVAGSLLEDGLHARITFPDGLEYWLEPIGQRVPGAAANQYVLYKTDDVIEHGGACGVDAMQMIEPIMSESPRPTRERGADLGMDFTVAEFAADADYEYFLAYGGVAGVESRINSIINTVNIQYERDVAITHEITAIVVRTAEPDPYSTIYAGDLARAFREYWLANHGDIQRDLAQLFTGRDLNGTWAGYAWIGVVCSDYAFSIVQSDYGPNYNLVTDLTAHEMGHNWGAYHCNCPTNTMFSAPPGTNQFNTDWTIPAIIAFRDTCPCLGGGGGGSPGGGEPMPATLTNVDVTLGLCTGGGLNEADQSDNNYVYIDAARQGNKYKTEVVVTGTSASPNVSRLDLTIETGVDTGTVKTTVYVYEWQRGRWTRLDSYNQPHPDTVKVIANLPHPGRYVSNSGNRIMLKIATEARTNQAPGGYAVRIDHAHIDVTP